MLAFPVQKHVENVFRFVSVCTYIDILIACDALKFVWHKVKMAVKSSVNNERLALSLPSASEWCSLREWKTEGKGENRQVLLLEKVNTCTTHTCSDKKKRRKLFESSIFHWLCILQRSYRATTFLSFGLLCFNFFCLFLLLALALLARKKKAITK